MSTTYTISNVYFSTKTDTNGTWHAEGATGTETTQDNGNIVLNITQHVTSGDCPISVDNIPYTVTITQP